MSERQKSRLLADLLFTSSASNGRVLNLPLKRSVFLALGRREMLPADRALGRWGRGVGDQRT